MTLDYEYDRNAIVQINSGETNTGVAPQQRPPLIPITGESVTPRIVQFDLELLDSATKIGRRLVELASLLGMGYFFGDVDSAADSKFTHNLGRVPVLIVWSLNVDGQDGRVLGRPEAGGPNVEPWTETEVYVRATATGRYSFFVL